MRTLLLTALILVVLAAAWFLLFKKDKRGDDKPEPEPVEVSQYSPAFNASIRNAVDDYKTLTEALVNWDTAAVNNSANEFKSALDSINLEEIKKDTFIYQSAPMFLDNSKAELGSFINAGLLDVKKEAFNRLSENLYNLLRTIRYDQETLYWQECPMALNNYNESGFWLSDSARIRNPYLGLKDPKYGKGMLKCGETKDSLDFQAKTKAGDDSKSMKK
jgi:hypothetical protein